MVANPKENRMNDYWLDYIEKHHIAIVFSCAIPTEEEEDLSCSSCTPDESGNNPPSHLEALYALGVLRRPGLLLRTERGDGSQTLTTFA